MKGYIIDYTDKAKQHHYIECKRCGLRSFNPNDIRERYCANCHVFHDDPSPERLAELFAHMETEKS